jgi:hypothetical protein
MCIKTISLHIKQIITNPALQTLLLTHHYGMRCAHILLESSVRNRKSLMKELNCRNGTFESQYLNIIIKIYYVH